MSTGQGEQRQPLSAERFRDVIGRLASGVTVVTTVADGLRYGTTASAVTSLSLEPPMLLVCLNKSSSTGQAIAAARHFAVNVLDQQHPDLAVRFAGKGDDKFAGVVTVEGSRGAPLLEGALATLECRVADEVTGGTHTIFIGEVDGTSARHGAPLAYFRGQFGRLEMAQDENALASLRAKVLRRDVVVGSALSVDGLAGELDMPRESVYYALEKLTGEGLVTRDQTGEFAVEPVTAEALEAGLRARRVILRGVVAVSIGSLTAEQVDGLRALVEAARPTDAEGRPRPYEDWRRSLTEFLQHLLLLAGGDRLIEAYTRANVAGIVATRVGESAAPERMLTACHASLTALVDAYARGQVAEDEAVEAMSRFIEYGESFAHGAFAGRDDL